MKTSVICFIVLVLLLSSCAEIPLEFEGRWIDTKSQSQQIAIRKNGDSYLVEASGNRIPAVLEGDFLRAGDNNIVFDQSNNELIFGGKAYRRMTGDVFVGKWAAPSRAALLDIEKVGDAYAVRWKSKSDMYREKHYDLVFQEGKLLKTDDESYGSVEVSFHHPNSISITVDDHPEFSAEVFTLSPTTSTFVVNSGDDYLGMWELGGQIFLSIRKSRNAYTVNVNNWNRWSARYTNGQLISSKPIREMGGSSRPIIELLEKDRLKLSDFYFEGGLEHEFVKSEHPDAFAPEEVEEYPNQQTQTGDRRDGAAFDSYISRGSANQDFYIINVGATATQRDAQVAAEELRRKGYSAGYLWIPDYASLTDAQLYSIYIGPFPTLEACANATAEYRKQHPNAYGLLVSHKNRRVEIRGPGNIEVIDPYFK